MELTNEEKVKVFAMYLGAKCVDNKGQFAILQGMVFMFGEMNATMAPDSNFAISLSLLKLVLKPVHKISDADKLSIGKS